MYGLITQIISFGVIIFLLAALLYKPIVRMLDERSEKVNRKKVR